MTRAVVRSVIVLLGAYVCLIATLAHQRMWQVAGADLPWGVALGVVATGFGAVACRRADRLGPEMFALGWGLGLLAPLLARNGSYLLAQDWLGVTFALAGVGALGVAIWRASTLTR